MVLRISFCFIVIFVAIALQGQTDRLVETKVGHKGYQEKKYSVKKDLFYFVISDSSGRVTDTWYERSDRKKIGKWTSFYTNGNIKSTGNYSRKKSTSKCGKWKNYYENGTLESCEIYKDRCQPFKKKTEYTYYTNGNIQTVKYYKYYKERLISKEKKIKPGLPIYGRKSPGKVIPAVWNHRGLYLHKEKEYEANGKRKFKKKYEHGSRVNFLIHKRKRKYKK